MTHPPPRTLAVLPRATGVSFRPLSLGIAVGAAVVVLAAMALVLLLGGFDVATAFRALVSGAVGSWYAVASATLVRAIPLIFTGLAVAIAFRGGILNIGAEGQLLAGAAAATAVANWLGTSPAGVVTALALLAAALAGACWTVVPAALRRRGVLEVISTIMLNFIALHGVGYLVRGPLQEPTRIYPQSETLDAALRLPVLLAGTRLHAGLLLALAAVGVAWYVLRFTVAGFRLRVVGQNPRAAATTAGLSVGKVATRAFLVSGLLAGLAGGVEVFGVTYALYENLSPGYGYTAIAVALLAGLRPGWIVVSGIFLGALAAGAAAMQREAGVPLVFVSVIEASIILAVVGGRVLLDRLAPRSAAGAT